MTIHHPHIIQQSTIHLQYNGRVDSFALQKEVDDWCHRQLPALLEDTLKPYNDLPGHILIDRLEIIVDLAANEEWKTVMTQAVTRQLKAKLSGLEQSGSGLSRKTTGQRFTDLLVFYLEKGFLPWWSMVKTKEDLVEQWWHWIRNQKNKKNEDEIRQVLKIDIVKWRLVRQSPVNLFYALVAKLNPAWNDLLPSLLNDLEKVIARYSNHQKQDVVIAFQMALLKNIDKSPVELIDEMTLDLNSQVGTFISTPAIDTIFDHKDLIKKSSGSSDPHVDLKKVDLTDKDPIFITNAGLIIIAPFLPMFFSRLQLVEEGHIMQPSTAISMLHYLFTGRNDPAEFELVLPKVLCGIKISDAIQITGYLTEAQEREANELLLSVIEHWSILKNTSIEGLREAFLRREGKLTFHKEEWLLQVEQKPYDMLLQHMPWNISFLKLPWMKYVLKTEWI